MAFQIDTGSKYYKFAVIWIIFTIILYVILLYLNEYLETTKFVLFVIALGVSGFATRWLLRNQYSD